MSFYRAGCCYTGYSLAHNNSPFYMGIPRLKFPSDAPSRSTLKLEEALHVFIPEDEWDERLANGMYAVDLGACPGGWTYQLVKRNMWVYSVDNGPMAQSLMDTGQVTGCVRMASGTVRTGIIFHGWSAIWWRSRPKSPR